MTLESEAVTAAIFDPEVPIGVEGTKLQIFAGCVSAILRYLDGI